MAPITLVIGGARSGKSAFAERLAAERAGDRVLYVATAYLSEDTEMGERIRAHRERRPAGWQTVEAGSGDLLAALDGAGGFGAVLVDSLTLWVSGRMVEEGAEDPLPAVEAFLERAAELPVPVILVSDEAGLGVVPERAEGRRFRDLLGLVNQRAAEAAGEVYLCVAGIGVRIK